MAYEFKNLSDVDQLDQLSDSTTIMGFENGKPVQFSSNKVGSVKTVNGSAPDENGNIEIQIATDIDWDGLNNKPFNEDGIINVEALPEGYPYKKTVHSDTLTWDGNTEGLVSVMGQYYKVSDAVPTIDDFSNGVILTVREVSVSISANDIEFFGGLILARVEGLGCLVVPEEMVGTEIEGIAFPESGVYSITVDDYYVKSITIPNYTGFTKTEVKTIDEDLLPDSVKGIIEPLILIRKE